MSGMKWADMAAEEDLRAADAAAAAALAKENGDEVRKPQTGSCLHDGRMIIDGKEITNAPAEFDQLNLRPELLEGVYLKGFDKPSTIQSVAIPIMLQNPPRHFVGQAQSGTGKTAAFCLGMLARVNEDLQEVQAVCICPTRELAVQNFQVLQELATKTRVKPLLLIPDPDASLVTGPEYARSFKGKYKHQIIVGTPGKVLDALKKRTLVPKNVTMFVLDEADEMLNGQNLGDQAQRIKKTLPKSTQMICFSATYSDAVNRFIDRMVPKPRTTAKLKREDVTIDNVEQYWIDCKSEQGRFSVLSDVYALLTVGLSIIFTAKKTTAQEIADRMIAEGHSVKLLSGAMEKRDRDKVIAAFRKSDFRALITTNVLARGIDIPAVTMVVNYDLPYEGREQQKVDYENYVHRIGRAGRWKRRGVAINFVHDERSRSTVKSIENFYGRAIDELNEDGLVALGEKLDEMDADLQSFTEDDVQEAAAADATVATSVDDPSEVAAAAASAIAAATEDKPAEEAAPADAADAAAAAAAAVAATQ